MKTARYSVLPDDLYESVTLDPGDGAAGEKVRAGNALTGSAGFEEGHEVMKAEARE